LKERGESVALLHPADVLFDFGLFAVMFGAATLLMLTLASRSGKKVKGRQPSVEGLNRAQRRRVTAEGRRTSSTKSWRRP
jgi:hypothetical protein